VRGINMVRKGRSSLVSDRLNNRPYMGSYISIGLRAG
jgi:hypothetical protein